MKKTFNIAKIEGIKHISNLLAISARTAPKARGQDNLEIVILDGKDLGLLVKKMLVAAKRDSRPTFKRDAESLKNSDTVVIVATKTKTLGLNCGYCGYKTCDQLSKTKGVCAYNPMDLGIALGSMVSLAANFHIDNRIMYSIGKIALEMGIFSKDAKIAIGIPLSATGKNPFFDRRI